jgi:tRNA nucleotidyltransferase (CCA-adding enzyme)
MPQPSVERLPPGLRDAARKVASALRAAGHEAWLVGGSVRDLALGREPADADLATGATPDEVERLFPRAKGVGRAFGTMLVVAGETVVQVTTFRSEHGYSDARRPDRVEFGRSVDEDARRRDFTCNALFLDPLTDELRDPTGGLADLGRGLLRCVGDARERFREDGLRLVRMARFAAALGLEIEPATLAAASHESASIAGVSGERLLGELETILSRPRSARALRLLDETGVLARALPGLGERNEDRWRAFDALPDPPGASLGFAALFDPALGGGRDAASVERAEAALEPLRPSRELRAAVRGAWELAAEVERLAEAPAPRSRRIRAARSPSWANAVALVRAVRTVRGRERGSLDELERFARSLAPGELRPAPWITSKDLEASGLPRGPAWGRALEEAESLQLDGAFADRAAALAWLAGRVASGAFTSAG